MTFPQIWELRRDQLLSLARLYQPDIALVDHSPAGLRGDLRNWYLGTFRSTACWFAAP